MTRVACGAAGVLAAGVVVASAACGGELTRSELAEEGAAICEEANAEISRLSARSPEELAANVPARRVVVEEEIRSLHELAAPAELASVLDLAIRNKEKTLALLDELAVRIERGQLDALGGLVADLMVTASAGRELFGDLGLEACA